MKPEVFRVLRSAVIDLGVTALGVFSVRGVTVHEPLGAIRVVTIPHLAWDVLVASSPADELLRKSVGQQNSTMSVVAFRSCAWAKSQRSLRRGVSGADRRDVRHNVPLSRHPGTEVWVHEWRRPGCELLVAHAGTPEGEENRH